MVTLRDPNNRKLPRASRRIIKHLLRHKGYHRATELRAAAGDLDHQVRSQSQRLPMPTDPGDKLTVRVRIGRETRVLLRRLQSSTNLRVQRALVREFRQDIANRIALHIKRSQALAKGRARARQAAAWARARVTDGGARAKRAWKGRGQAAPQVRNRAPRTAAVAALPSRAARPRRSRAVRWGRSRSSRGTA